MNDEGPGNRDFIHQTAVPVKPEFKKIRQDQVGESLAVAFQLGEIFNVIRSVEDGVLASI